MGFPTATACRRPSRPATRSWQGLRSTTAPRSDSSGRLARGYLARARCRLCRGAPVGPAEGPAVSSGPSEVARSGQGRRSRSGPPARAPVPRRRWPRPGRRRPPRARSRRGGGRRPRRLPPGSPRQPTLARASSRLTRRDRGRRSRRRLGRRPRRRPSRPASASAAARTGRGSRGRDGFPVPASAIRP